ncbi:VWA domain-containing protein [Ahrensia sp. R2A130]|uniref:vWA domain-containing protein n=1 Tax=Ahrensia sp. R2A130 TaxID=744979 RepID=UPI0001E09CC9|nr:VWA domain-containing protein [Ahrensia sp. R2A130]EFL88225.1 von Willebrand factor, type A [Ahrensia sp. R2A130]
MLKRFALILAAASLTLTQPANAQQTQSSRNVMVVFDGSGSMWGQIEGRAKIEIARDVLSSVLGETTSNMTIGMIAYGHRKKGQCSDIETVVAPGPAASTVPEMIARANAIKPKGKTPLSDAVRKAAESLRYTENEATVVLVTDGIETCNADPCALATELEESGVDFTTHVVGFGLSKDEGRQVACLAANTGGKFISADDADELKAALDETLSDFEEEPEIDQAVLPRNVQLTLRDTSNSEMLTKRHLEVTPDDSNAQPWPSDFQLSYESAPSSAEGRFLPGTYAISVRRAGTGRAEEYTAPLTFTVEPGEGVQVIDIAMAARLKVNAFIRAGLPYDPKNPPAGGVKNSAYLYVALYPVENDVVSEQPVIIEEGGFEIGVPPGRYLLRGTMDRTTTREREIDVDAGGLTEIDFDMDLSTVTLVAQQDGQATDRQTTYFYDKPPAGRNYWRGGFGSTENPFYLPAGQWAVNLGREGGGKRRSEILLEVPATASAINLAVPEGQTLSEADLSALTAPSYRPCKAYVGVRHTGCLVPFADQQSDGKEQAKSEPDTLENKPRAMSTFADFQGFWARIGNREGVDPDQLAQLCTSTPLAILQDGRMIDLRRSAEGFIQKDQRACVPHESGEFDCKPEGAALLISLVPDAPNPQLCLGGPDGRSGSRLCARMQRCDADAFAGLDQSARDALEAAPR